MATRTKDSVPFLSKEVTGGANWPHADGWPEFTFPATGAASESILPQKESESNRARPILPAGRLTLPTCEAGKLCYVSVTDELKLTWQASRPSLTAADEYFS